MGAAPPIPPEGALTDGEPHADFSVIFFVELVFSLDFLPLFQVFLIFLGRGLFEVHLGGQVRWGGLGDSDGRVGLGCWSGLSHEW